MSGGGLEYVAIGPPGHPKLDRIADMRCLPCAVVSDNRTGIASNAILKWQEYRCVEWHYIALGYPMRNQKEAGH